jgi:hypothetical protein
MERATGVEPATSSLGSRCAVLRKNLATISYLLHSLRPQSLGSSPIRGHGFPPFPRQIWVMDG